MAEGTDGGTVFVGIEPEDLTRFEAKFNAEMKTVAAKLGRQFGDTFADAYGKQLSGQMGRKVATAVERAQREAGDVEVKVDVDKASLKHAKDKIDGLSDGVLRFGLSAAKSAGKVGLLTSAIGLGTIGIARFGAALAPAAGALIALPAVAGAAGAAVGTLKLGLMGVADTLESGLTGDTEKYAAGLAKLAPAARATVREVVALKPAFDKLRKSVQQELFTGIAGQLKVLSGVYMPALQRRLPPIAASLSVFAENFSRAARSGPLLKGVNAVLDSTADALARANNHIGPLTNAIGNLMVVGAPVVERLGAGFDNLARKFADFINGAAASGRLDDMLNTAIDTLKTLATLVGNVGSILSSVFSAAAATGGGFLQTLVRLTGQIGDFLKSAEGTAALKAVFGALAAVGKALGDALGAVLPAIAKAFVDMAPAIPPLAQALAGVVIAVTPLVPMLAQLAITLAGALTSALVTLTPYLEKVVGWLTDHSEGVRQFVIGILAAAAAWKAYQIVTTAVAIAQAALNVVMALNPLGLVILAVVALVAALVLLWKNSETFRDIVIGAWNAVRDAAVSVWGAIVDASLWAWNTVIKPTWDAIVASLKTVGGWFTWLWKNAISPAWTGIKVVIDIAYAAIQVYFGLIQIALKILGAAFSWLWTNIVRPVMGWIGDKINTAWRVVIKPVFDLLMDGLKAVGGVFQTLWNGGVKPVMGWIGDKIRDTWNKVIKPIFEIFRDFISKSVQPKFKEAVEALGKIWSGLQDAAKKPISFIIDTVLNNGLLKAYNFIASKFGVKPDNVRVTNPFATAPKNNDRSTHHDFADGGVLPGYTPGRDVHQFYSPTAGRLNLSGGEGILRPEVVKALGAGTIHAMNANARKGGRSFALGGILPDFGSILDKVTSFAKSPKDGLTEVLNGLLGKIPGAKYLVDLASSLPKKLVSGLADKLSEMFSMGGGGAGGKINVGGSGVQRWAGIVGQVLSMLGAPSGALSAVLTRIRIESGGNPNAINLWDSNARAGHPSQGLMQTIPGTFSAYAGPFRGRGITDPLANIYAGVNYAMHRYGSNWINVMTRGGGYDNGGWLAPGMSMVENKTGKPEAILNPQQWADISRLAGAGAGGGRHTTYNITTDVAHLLADLRAKEDAAELRDRLIP